MKKRRSLIIIAILLLVLGVLLALPFTRSLLVMSVYSATEAKNGVLAQEKIDLKLQGGLATSDKDWYPLMMTFNADNFANYVNQDVDLTILYTFGVFDYNSHCATLYDNTSDYHGAFYGAYAVKSREQTAFGYHANGTVNTNQMAKVFAYDLKTLVLKSIGCQNPIFEYTVTDTTTVNLHGRTYTVINAHIITNSPLHTVTQNHMAYMQYGKPTQLLTQKDFKKMQTYGRIYASEIKDKNVTLCFYIIAPNQKVLDEAEQIIKKAKLTID